MKRILFNGLLFVLNGVLAIGSYNQGDYKTAMFLCFVVGVLLGQTIVMIMVEWSRR